MGTVFKRLEQPPPVLGLDWQSDEHKLKPGALVTADNVRFGKTFVEKVGGWAVACDTTDGTPANLITRQLFADGTGRNIVGTTEKLYELAADGTSVTAISAAMTGASDTRWEADQLGATMYFTNLTDPVLQLDSDDTLAGALGGGPPKAAHLCQFENHLMLAQLVDAGISAYDGIANSGLGDPTDWAYTDPDSDADSDQIRDGGDSILRILRLGNLLVAYKQSSAHVISYIKLPDVWNKTAVPNAPGLLSARGVVDAMSLGHILVGVDNIYRFDGTQFAAIGDKIWRTFYAGIDADSRVLVTAFHNRLWKEIIFAYLTPEGSREALVWNYQWNAWSTRDWPFVGMGILTESDVIAWSAESGTWDEAVGSWDSPIGLVTYGGDDAGKVYRIEQPDVYTGAGVALTATLETGDLDYGAQGRQVMINHLDVDVPRITGGALNYYVCARQNLTDALVWQGPYAITGTTRLEVLAQGRYIRHRFVKADGYFKMSGFHPWVRVGSAW